MTIRILSNFKFDWRKISASALLILLLSSAKAAYTAEQSLAMSRVETNIFHRGKRIDQEVLNALTQEQRAELERYIWYKVMREQKDWGDSWTYMNGSGEVLELALLGDDAARWMVTQAFVEGRDDSLVYLNDARVIPLVGEQLFKNEELLIWAGDLGIIAKQERARHDILELLVNSGAFDDEVRAWAKRVRSPKYVDTDPAGTEIMRAWYRANEPALKNWDFKAVKAGAEPVRPAGADQDAGSRGYAEGIRAAKASLALRQASAHEPESSGVKIGGNRILLCVSGAGLLLLAIGFFVIKRKSKP